MPLFENMADDVDDDDDDDDEPEAFAFALFDIEVCT
jgi:hypothetical protein